MNQAAWAAIRINDGILLRDFYDRVRSTAGKKKAIIAVARKMLEIQNHLEIIGYATVTSSKTMDL